MEDYYMLLEVDYEASLDSLNDAYKNKLIEFKALPFLTHNDKEKIKKIKKANFIFNNSEYKKIYDEFINNKFRSQINNFEENKTSRKNIQNQTYLADRIFSFQKNNKYNLKHNELLRPKNVGLSSDEVVVNDPNEIIGNETIDFKPFNFDS